MKDKLQAYLQHLQSAELAPLLSLFAAGASVYSPLYGKQTAPDFYQQLFADSAAAQISHLHTFISHGIAALYFQYGWTLKNGQTVAFEVVDIIEFDEHEKITSLRIIYDTAATKPAFQMLKNEA